MTAQQFSSHQAKNFALQAAKQATDKPLIFGSGNSDSHMSDNVPITGVFMSRINAVSILPLAAALVTGCATTQTAPSVNPADELVPVSSVAPNPPVESSFLQSLTDEQRETYRNLAVNLGAVMGSRGNPQNAIAARIFSMMGR